MLDDVWQIITGFTTNIEAALAQQYVLIQFPALAMITLGKIRKHVGKPLRADFEESHLQSWKPLRNPIHDHVMKRAHEHHLELREADGFVLEVVEQDWTAGGGMNAEREVQSAGRVVERKEVGVA